jgi:hypothetical protein
MRLEVRQAVPHAVNVGRVDGGEAGGDDEDAAHSNVITFLESDYLL